MAPDCIKGHGEPRRVRGESWGRPQCVIGRGWVSFGCFFYHFGSPLGFKQQFFKRHFQDHLDQDSDQIGSDLGSFLGFVVVSLGLHCGSKSGVKMSPSERGVFARCHIGYAIMMNRPFYMYLLHRLRTLPPDTPP